MLWLDMPEGLILAYYINIPSGLLSVIFITTFTDIELSPLHSFNNFRKCIGEKILKEQNAKITEEKRRYLKWYSS